MVLWRVGGAPKDSWGDRVAYWLEYSLTNACVCQCRSCEFEVDSEIEFEVEFESDSGSEFEVEFESEFEIDSETEVKYEVDF